MSHFTKPSEAPSGGDWKFSDEENLGSLFVLEPVGEEQEMANDFGGTGTSKYIPCNVTKIDYDDPANSETHENVYIFPAWIRGVVRGLIADGGMALGTLAQDKSKGKGKNAAWVLEDPDDEDIEAATAWLNARSAGQLGGKKGKKGKK